jgi:hypothetical protein
LQHEPWGFLLPEVVRHGGEQVTNIAAAIPDDTDPDAANVERLWVMLH